MVVLVPRYGIEGIVYTCKSGEHNPFTYDAKRDVLAAPGCVLRTFDRVRVRISSARRERARAEAAADAPHELTSYEAAS